MSPRRNFFVDLRISSEEYLKLYSGAAQNVHARSRDGLRVQFPASALRPYVTSSGIAGSFEIITDDHNKLIQIKRIA